ncbi:MAG: nucleotidyltransferase family protein [Armatimonadota bacterium]
MRHVRIEIPKERIDAFCTKWRVRELALFGSVLSDDFRPESDVDVLISIYDDARWSAFDLVDMVDELKSIFGREVDLLEKEALRNPYRRHSILSNREILYAA